MGLSPDHLRAGHLAEAVGRAVETISNIERGYALTGLETLEGIAKAA